MKPVHSLREGIARGGACLAKDARDAVVAFVLSRKCDDGGFSGRASASDLYYTLFAAATLDALAHRRTLLLLPRYLKRFGDGESLDFVHLTCLASLLGRGIRPAKLNRVLARLETYRSRDGGYSHLLPDANVGSAYAAHLAVEAYATVHTVVPNEESLAASLERLRVPSGGYANMPSASAGQTNATAAACVVRSYLGLEPEPACGTFLLEQFDAESGGFRAYPKARTADLLSTASALYALETMGISLDAIAPGCRLFVESLWCEDGGFCGTSESCVADCEYTCYALLALGALA